MIKNRGQFFKQRVPESHIRNYKKIAFAFTNRPQEEKLSWLLIPGENMDLFR
jgi:hypothetical protein